MTWKVFRLIDEEDDRTSSDEIEGFVNEQLQAGWGLAAASDGFLFFSEVAAAKPDATWAENRGVAYDSTVDDVPDEEPAPAPIALTSRPVQGGEKRPARPADPSIRQTGQTEPAIYSGVQVDPKILQGVAPAQPLPSADADPFGLGG